MDHQRLWKDTLGLGEGNVRCNGIQNSSRGCSHSHIGGTFPIVHYSGVQIVSAMSGPLSIALLKVLVSCLGQTTQSLQTQLLILTTMPMPSWLVNHILLNLM